MAEDVKCQLDEIETQLMCIEQQIENLLEQQQKLVEQRDLLRAQLDAADSEEAQEQDNTSLTTDWETGEFSWSDKMRETLKSVFKIDTFRSLQASCINATLSLKDTILIMPTGGGKSLCYQLPAVLSSGITLVISPLVSLMEDQLMSVKTLGIESSLLNASCSKAEVTRVHNAMTDKQSGLKLLYVTPEKISKSKRFMSKLEKVYELGRLSRIVIDEVHCVSQWGHDFRPDYKILGILKGQFPSVPILGLTATATAKVLTDVREMLSLKQCLTFRASYNRRNLIYEVRVKPAAYKTQIEEMVALIKERFSSQSGIVYCLSRKDTEQVCVDLCQNGIKAGCYHADLPPEERSRVHRQWLKANLQVIVATVAFGMGIDKADVRFVIHHTISKSIENYYQESGRAGRDGGEAHCVVYFRAADLFRQSTMVFTEHTGLHNLYVMLKYCINKVHCRRSLIAKCFGEEWKPEDCSSGCDICQGLSSQCSNTDVSNCTDTKSETGGSRTMSCRPPSIDEDVSVHCQSLVEVVEQAQLKQQRLTAPKVIEAWKKKQKKTAKSEPDVETTCDSDGKRELILLHSILEGVLKEEFHFTPYSTISYIGLGRKASRVKAGTLKITLQCPLPQSVGKKKRASGSNVAKGGHADGNSTEGCSVKKRATSKLAIDDDDNFEPSVKKRRRSVKQSKEEKGRKLESNEDMMKTETGPSGVVMIEID